MPRWGECIGCREAYSLEQHSASVHRAFNERSVSSQWVFGIYSDAVEVAGRCITHSTFHPKIYAVKFISSDATLAATSPNGGLLQTDKAKADFGFGLPIGSFSVRRKFGEHSQRLCSWPALGEFTRFATGFSADFQREAASGFPVRFLHRRPRYYTA